MHNQLHIGVISAVAVRGETGVEAAVSPVRVSNDQLRLDALIEDGLNQVVAVVLVHQKGRLVLEPADGDWSGK